MCNLKKKCKIIKFHISEIKMCNLNKNANVQLKLFLPDKKKTETPEHLRYEVPELEPIPPYQVCSETFYRIHLLC